MCARSKRRSRRQRRQARARDKQEETVTRIIRRGRVVGSNRCDRRRLRRRLPGQTSNVMAQPSAPCAFTLSPVAALGAPFLVHPSWNEVHPLVPDNQALLCPCGKSRHGTGPSHKSKSAVRCSYLLLTSTLALLLSQHRATLCRRTHTASLQPLSTPFAVATKPTCHNLTGS